MLNPCSSPLSSPLVISSSSARCLLAVATAAGSDIAAWAAASSALFFLRASFLRFLSLAKELKDLFKALSIADSLNSYSRECCPADFKIALSDLDSTFLDPSTRFSCRLVVELFHYTQDPSVLTRKLRSSYKIINIKIQKL